MFRLLLRKELQDGKIHAKRRIDTYEHNITAVVNSLSQSGQLSVVSGDRPRHQVAFEIEVCIYMYVCYECML